MSGMQEKVESLDRDLNGYIDKGVDNDDPARFNELALRAFELQYDSISLYAKYCEKRGAVPGQIHSWTDIPAVPTDVFKSADLSLFPLKLCRTFMTSGTTGMSEKGKVHYDEGGLRLMDATISTAASAFLFPDNIKAAVFIIAPEPSLAPHMVMAYGMQRLREYFGLPESRFFVGPDGFDRDGFIEALGKVEQDGTPAAIFGGSFGFVNFFDYCLKKGIRFQLTPGSRCLDAGGFKGRSREVERDEFLDSCGRFLGIPDTHCINLLGMTEIASQFYDSTLRDFWEGKVSHRVKVNPPWTRTTVVDPDTLDPLPPGETGLLRHLDLANRGHICAIQTDDTGRMVQGGFEILGRVSEGESRGCSITIDEMTRMREES